MVFAESSLLNGLYRVLARISDRSKKVLEAMGAALILACTVTLLFQVLYRFIIIKFVSFSFPFTEEFARYALIWSVYLVIGVCLRDGSQVAVNLVYERLNLRNRHILYYFTRVLMLVFLGFVMWYSVGVVQKNLIFRSSTLRLPGIYIFSAPLVGCILMSFETIVEILGVLTGNVKPYEVRPLSDAVSPSADSKEESE
jgi:TRAP-type C4-dicarboxylate transport system permease small subunit